MVNKPGAEMAKRILVDLENGVEAPTPAPSPASPPAVRAPRSDDQRSWGQFTEAAAGSVPTDHWALLDGVWQSLLATKAVEDHNEGTPLTDEQKFAVMEDMYNGAERVMIRGVVASTVRTMKSNPVAVPAA